MARYKRVFLGLLFLTLSACQPSETKAPTALPENTLPAATISPSPIVITPTTIPKPSSTPVEPTTPTNQPVQKTEKTPSPVTHNSDPKNIASGVIYWTRWSPDSKTLFYADHLEGDFAYDLENDSIQELTAAEVLRQTPTPDILAQLPPYYRVPHISPSGNKAIYINQTDSPPTPTIDPVIDEAGERGTDNHQLDLWLWEDNSSQILGNPLQCQLDESFWTSDEQKVVLVEYRGRPGPCPIETQAWLFDLENNTYTPLFPTSDFGHLQVYGFSPNNDQLLIGFFSDFTGANLHFLDINTLDLTSIDAPVYSFIQWVDEENILIKYHKELSSSPYPVGVLNLQTLEFTELLPMFNDNVENVVLSPDQKWIAFSVGGRYPAQNKLWLMEFELSHPWWATPD
ncbi:MAG: hypothetical protein R6X34_18620 [Chloroflexota bacterium]